MVGEPDVEIVPLPLKYSANGVYDGAEVRCGVGEGKTECNITE